VILASAASSVPDTIISMNDARKGNYDDAISNALGSNIFDICFALGFPLFLYTLIHGPVHMHQEIIEMSGELRMLLLLLTIMAVSIYVISKKIGMLHAIFLLLLYGVFSVYVIGRGLENEFSASIAEQLQQLVKYISIFNW
jgi:cation:H+ antiporter